MILLDILNFKTSSDQGTPLIGCFRRNHSIDLQIKMHFLLIYEKSLKNNFERVHFSEKFQVMGSGGEIMAAVGGGGEIMADRGWSWIVARFSNARKKVFVVFLVIRRM